MSKPYSFKKDPNTQNKLLFLLSSVLFHPIKRTATNLPKIQSFIHIIQSTQNHSNRRQRQIIRTISDQQHKTKYPYSIERPSREFIVLELSIRFLVYHEVKEHHSAGVDVIERFELREEYAETVKKTYRIGEPRDVTVQEKRRNDK